MRRIIVCLCVTLLPVCAVKAEDSADRCLGGATCPREATEPYPETGIWFNPDEPGSGFLFEVQNAALAGYYFGYDSNGNPLWYLFSGQLQLNTAGPATWTLDADLQRYQDGACIDCEFVPPADPVTEGSIKFEFFTRTQAKFSVDGGPRSRIQSFTFGIETHAIFPELDYRFPDLEGQWLFIVYDRESELEGGNRRQYAAVGRDLWLVPGELEEGHAFYGLIDFQNFPERIYVGALECLPQTNGPGGECTVSIGQPPLSPKTYFMSVTNVSDTYFSATATDGDTIEGFRVNYD